MTQSRDAMKKHGNKAHGKKRIADEDLFDRVRLQSWFWEGKERYWVVDETKEPVPMPQPNQNQAPDPVRVEDAGVGPSEGPDQNNPDSRDDSDDTDDQIYKQIMACIIWPCEVWTHQPTHSGFHFFIHPFWPGFCISIG